MNKAVEDDRTPVAQIYCAPVFIGNRFKMLLKDPLQRGENDCPALRNGTLTFVSFDGSTYALTCQHVINELTAERERFQRPEHCEPGMPAWLTAQLFVPHGQDHVHVNARFYPVPAEVAGAVAPDVAIARVSATLLARLGLSAIPMHRLDAVGDEPREEQNALATGFTEANRRVQARNDVVGNLIIQLVQASASLTTIDARGLRMISELDHAVIPDNLSGMSGGPIFWRHDNRWGLAGIVQRGRDLQPKPDGNSAFAGPVLWIEGERVSQERLRAWVSAIPSNDAPLEDCSAHLYIPESLR